MQPQATPAFVISQMRVQTMREIPFFCVISRPVPFADLDKDLDPMLDKLDAAWAQANMGKVTAEVRTDIIRYYGADEVDLWRMEVGIPVKAGTEPTGAAQVKTLPPFRCAGLLLWGSLAHIMPAYDALKKAMQEAGLEHSGENREWVYYFESGESPHNLMGIYMGVE
jgi:effector-binding domain-containing protein